VAGSWTYFRRERAIPCGSTCSATRSNRSIIRPGHATKCRRAAGVVVAAGVRTGAGQGIHLSFPLRLARKFWTRFGQDPMYLSISEGRRHPGMEHWVPLFHTVMENLLDYLPEALGQPGPPIRRGAGSASGNDRRPCAGQNRASERRRGAIPGPPAWTIISQS